jgi:hypothetical protein
MAGAPHRPIEFEGHSYRNRMALARHLARITGHTAEACSTMLRKLADDGSGVVARFRASDEQSCVTVGGRTYKDKTAFFRHLQRHYGVKETTAWQWAAPSILGLSLDQIEQRAKQLRAKRRPNQKYGEVIIFGWRFKSVSAACGYYRVGQGRGAIGCRGHIENGKPAFEFFLPAVARLWESGQLDERNRFPPEVEARMPKRMLPLNEVMEEVTDAYERKWMDAYYPDNVESPRRHALRQLDRLRSMAARQAVSQAP